MTTRRDVIRAGAGLAAILAAGKVPAGIVKSMLGARGAVLAARRKPKLPYDAEVEYLESTGTQYIDTGIGHVSDSGFSVTGCFLISTRDVFPVLAGVSLANESNWFNVYEDGDYSFAGTVKSGVFTVNARNVVTAYANYLNDGLVYYDNDPSDRLEGNPVVNARYMLFCAGSENGPMAFSEARIYGFKATIGQEIVRDFQPVRFTNELGQSEGAMYDLANPMAGMNPDGSPRTDGLYRNRGTGAFTWAEKSA